MQTEKERFFCKDCKHRFVKFSEWPFYLMGFQPIFWSCRKSYEPTHEEPDLVAGTKTVQARYHSCSSSRIGRSKEGNCGEDAYYWEPRHKRDLFKLIRKAEQDASKS